MAPDLNLTGSPALLVSWDGGGNVPPMLALGKRLMAGGRSVCLLGPSTLESRARRAGLTYRPFAARQSWVARADRAIEDDKPAFAAHVAGPEIALELLAAIEDVRPALLVIDGMAAGALCAAERLEVPTAVLVHTRYRYFATEQGAPNWSGLFGMINATRAQLGLEPLRRELGWLPDLWERAGAVVVSSLRELEGPGPELPVRVRHVGPVLDPSPAPLAPEVAAIVQSRDAPLVVISLSTTCMHHEEVARRIVSAVSAIDASVVVTLGHALEPSALGAHGDTVISSWAAHESLLPYADAVVTHGGLGTILQALSAGVPLVCLPMGRDQGFNAASVERLGAGVVLDPGSAPEQIRQAVLDVLRTASYRTAAQTLASQVAGLGGGQVACEGIETLASTHTLERVPG